ncbi:MAG: sulfotransferase family protein [Bacteroidota bacterium]
MKIFCIGLSRTGTSSLTDALDILGFNAFHFPHILHALGQIYIRRKFYQYDALSDTPVTLNYKKLDRKFPNSKFILTTREKENWLKSCSNYPAFQKTVNPSPKKKVRVLRKKLYGSIYFDKATFSKAYDDHHQEVKSYFKGREKNLLILDITKGETWEQLCPFLDVPIPDTDFPKVNTIENLGWKKAAAIQP